MSFRKRNVALSSGPSKEADSISNLATKPAPIPPGIRPSPLDGRATTSTGTHTLDGLFAGHAGLPMGTSVLIEENSSTDYAGALLRYYAAEGLVQGHQVHVMGVPEQWGRELPGLVGSSEKEKNKDSNVAEKMKIAWRYEHLGQSATATNARGGRLSPCHSIALEQYIVAAQFRLYLGFYFANGTPIEPSPGTSSAGSPGNVPSDMHTTFCHTYDLTKRLVHPSDSVLNLLRIDLNKPDQSPYISALKRLSSNLTASPANTAHRLVIPALLSPALYPPHASSPEHILQFLHSVRSLLSKYSTRLTAMITLPLTLYPRSSGLVRWMELLNDGVVELSPFPHSYPPDTSYATSATSATQEEPPQGLLRIHRLPILHERGGATIPVGEDWSFTLSRRKFTIKPFSLPPIEGDTEAQHKTGSEQKGKKADMDF